MAKDILAASKGMRVAATYADPTLFIKTGADVVSIADTFEMNGVPLEASVNNREQYAHAIHSALGEEIAPGVPRLQILKSGCPYLIKSLPQMTYDPKNPLRMAEHKHDHPVVTLAYFLMSSGVLSNTKPPPTRSRNPYLLPEKTSRFTLGRESARTRLR